MLFYLVGRACVGNARRLKVLYEVDDVLDPLLSRAEIDVGDKDSGGGCSPPAKRVDSKTMSDSFRDGFDGAELGGFLLGSPRTKGGLPSAER